MPFDPMPPLPEDDHRLVREAIAANVDQTLSMIPEVVEDVLARHLPLRSAVVLETCRSLGGTIQNLHTVAAVLEYLNVAALLHRNLEIAENSRRQQHEVQQLWGSEASVLLGDYLLSISFQTLTRLGNLDVLDAVALLTKDIARGQILEISGDLWSVTPQQWEPMIRQKRAGLFATGAKCGAIWAGADARQQATLYDYGLNLGVAVQAGEDCRNTSALETLCAALSEGRPLLPICLLLHEHGSPATREQWRSQLDSLSEAEKPIWLLERISAEKMTERTEAWMQSRQDAACAALDQIPGWSSETLRQFATLNPLKSST
jgi:octaprenyl-diphosphate synthase